MIKSKTQSSTVAEVTEMISVWSAQTELPHFDELNSDISTDVLVVGGGLAGGLLDNPATGDLKHKNKKGD